MVLAGLAGAALVLRSRRPPPPPPAPGYTTDAEGVRIAHLDIDAITAWCRTRGLPDPPGVRQAEPVFAEELTSWLARAAEERSAEAYGRVGMISEGVEAHRAAEEYFRLATGADPHDHRWPYYLGCLCQVTGRDGEAREHLERARALRPGYPVTWARLGQLELEAGRLGSAEARFREYSRLQPDDWLGDVGLARIALQRGQPEEALVQLEKARKRGGEDDFQVCHQLGRVHAALGNRETATAWFERARDLPQGGWYRMRDPLDRELHSAVASVANLHSRFERMSGSGEYAQLAALAEEILRRRSRDVTMTANLASLYRQLGRIQDADAALDRAFRMGGNALRLHCLRSEIRLAQSDFEAALAAADRALALDGESARAHGLRARSLLMLGRAPEAIGSMRRSIALQGDDLGNHLVLGEILLQLGDLDGAAAAYRHVLEHGPDNAHARARIEAIAANQED